MWWRFYFLILLINSRGQFLLMIRRRRMFRRRFVESKASRAKSAPVVLSAGAVEDVHPPSRIFSANKKHQLPSNYVFFSSFSHLKLNRPLQQFLVSGQVYSLGDLATHWLQDNEVKLFPCACATPKIAKEGKNSTSVLALLIAFCISDGLAKIDI